MSDNLPPYRPEDQDELPTAPLPPVPPTVQPDPGVPPPPPEQFAGPPPPPPETYGAVPPAPQHYGISPQSTSVEDDRLWAAIGHLGIVASLLAMGTHFGFFVSFLIPLGIFFWKNSNFVKFHCAQACVYQLAVGIILTLLAVVSVPLMIILIGFLVIFLVYILGLAAFVYGIYAAVQVKQGRDFRYPFVADFVESTLNVHP